MSDKLSPKSPFDPKAISWRVGSLSKDKSKGMALAYIDARDVMERLDEVLGSENWQDKYEFHGARTVCYLSIKIGGEWVTKADGAGDSDVEAEKGAISDAFKRAAVKWGIGRYLYDVQTPWVELDEWKHIKQSEMPKLWRALGVAAPPMREDKQLHEPETVPEPPRAKEPAVSTKAIGLERELKQCTTPDDLNKFQRTKDFTDLWATMNETDRKYIAKAGAEHRRKLTATVADDRLMGG